MRSPIAELLDTTPALSMEGAVRQVAKTVPGVAGLDKYFVRKVGFSYYIDLHVLVDGRTSVIEGHRIAHEVEGAILAAQPKVAKVLVHVEPTAETRY
jgi:divalent metal cation (Fe/Co/Zn/Cd) transporter